MAYKKYWEARGFDQREIKEELVEGLLAKDDLPYFRNHTVPGHWTASAFVWDPVAKKLLLMHHRKLQKWLQPGGHADGDKDLEMVARKETIEETGIVVENPASWAKGMSILDFDIHEIPARKSERAHLHFDVRYLYLADSNIAPVQNEESNGVAWIDESKIPTLTNEESLLRPLQKIKQGGWSE